jgi:hypothetical protein
LGDSEGAGRNDSGFAAGPRGEREEGRVGMSEAAPGMPWGAWAVVIRLVSAEPRGVNRMFRGGAARGPTLTGRTGRIFLLDQSRRSREESFRTGSLLGCSGGAARNPSGWDLQGNLYQGLFMFVLECAIEEF